MLLAQIAPDPDSILIAYLFIILLSGEFNNIPPDMYILPVSTAEPLNGNPLPAPAFKT